jgi:putative aldouronate transport system permease protein
MPSIATIGLFYAVGHWNAWFGAMLYINDTAKLPVQNILRSIIAASNMNAIDSAAYDLMTVRPPSQAIRAAAVVICTTPILLVYPFIQKYFVKGVMVGSRKG